MSELPSMQTPDPSSRPLRVEFVVSYNVNDEMVLYAPEHGQAVSLNRSAGAIWDLCDGSNTLLEISTLLADWSGCPSSAILADVQHAVANLVSNGLVKLPNSRN
jgi:Coenzyme PQQ synthesis protein D (PqqD)